MNRSPYILLAVAGLLAVIVLVLTGLSFFNHTEKDASQERAVLTPTPVTQADPAPIHYATSSSEKMLDIVKNRTALSNKDASLRKNLIDQASSDYIYSSSNVRMEYLSSPDQFMVEILTQDVATAKNEASSFFSSLGMSQNGICHLPLIFYLSTEARRSLPANYEFDPLPEGC